MKSFILFILVMVGVWYYLRWRKKRREMLASYEQANLPPPKGFIYWFSIMLVVVYGVYMLYFVVFEYQQ